MKRWFLVGLTALFSLQAQAAAVLFTTESAYLSALGTTTTYVDFAGSPLVSVAGSSFTPAVTFGTCVSGVCSSSVLHGSDAITDLGGGPGPFGVAAVGGSFSAPVRAFGFHYISGGMGAIELNSGSTTLAVGSTSEGFVGVLADSDIINFIGINHISAASGAADRYFIDDFRINSPSPLPEPGSLALLGLALAGLELARRRRWRRRG